MRLSHRSQWESRWSQDRKRTLSFDISKPIFRETHQILSHYLPPNTAGTFLEVGAYPGKYLWYFHNYYGYAPWGVEYVESCAREAQQMLTAANVPGRIIIDDFFNLKKESWGHPQGWDLVASFGFVEHFKKPIAVVAKHLEMTRPGGFVVVAVPNHFGWNGRILRHVDKDKWRQHNGMSLGNLTEAFKLAGYNTILFAGFTGHIGFWNTGLYRRMKDSLGQFYFLARFPFWLIERLGQHIIPNNPLSSPEILVIARKHQ
jgi:SAM-dependent methyltransferase